jgi:histidinol-phosphate aminotransferase
MISRRRFVTSVGLGAAGVATGSWIAARGREDSVWSLLDPTTAAQSAQPGPMIVLSSNENPLGPGQTVLDAVRSGFGPAGGAPGRYSGGSGPLVEALAKYHGVQPANIVLGCGSTQILRTVTHLHTARDRALVGTIPTYEECAGYADMMGHPVRAVPLDADFQVELGRLADAARGAGLVFFCNPNNPAATYVPARETRDFIARLHRISPQTKILVDEAYFEYVTHPDHATFIPQAVEDPRIIVARTFSKAYGMAGLRVGYAIGHPDTIREMSQWDGGSGTSSMNIFALTGALAAVTQDASFVENERRRNTAVRDFTMKWFADRGMKPTQSHTNFMFVNIGRPVRPFREACVAKGVRVARDFPPFENTHCRISFGTMEEMQKAVQVFGEVLGRAESSAA